MTTIGERMEDMRDELFVGRERELQILGSLLGADTRHRFAYVRGMGGVGKTELLRRFGRIAADRGWNVHRVDGRSVQPALDAVREALDAPAQMLGRCVLFLDTFEQLESVAGAIREQLLPGLSDDQRLVIAGRRALDGSWCADTGWTELAHVFELGELSAGEAATYLARRGLEIDQVDAVIESVGGFPLALALAAEALSHGESAHDALDSPGFVDEFLRTALDIAPSPLHQQALVTAAVVQHTTEDLLADVVDRDAAPELFEWLRQRSYIRTDPSGAFLQDPVRKALLGNVRRTKPCQFHATLVAAARYYDRLRRQTEPLSAVGDAPSLFDQLFETLKRTLRSVDRPDCLLDDPLIDLQVVRERAGGDHALARAQALVALLRELASEFCESPRDTLYFEILERTYFCPTGKQRAVADSLGMSFSSYRRHLSIAIDRLATALYQHELAHASEMT